MGLVWRLRIRRDARPVAELCLSRNTQLMDESLQWLMAWYLRQCDGEWEHSYGVKLETLDNPGWRLRIALRETPLHGRPFTRIEHGEIAAHLEEWQEVGSWWVVEVNDDMFEANCGPLDLHAVIALFRKWVEAPEL